MRSVAVLLWCHLAFCAAEDRRTFKLGLISSTDDPEGAEQHQRPATQIIVMKAIAERSKQLGGIPTLDGGVVDIEYVLHPVMDTANKQCGDPDWLLNDDTEFVRSTGVNAVLLNDCLYEAWGSALFNNSATGYQEMNSLHYMSFVDRLRYKNFADLGVTVFQMRELNSELKGYKPKYGWSLDVNRFLKGKALVSRVGLTFEKSVGYEPRIGFMQLNEGGWYNDRVNNRVKLLQDIGKGDNIVARKVLYPFAQGCRAAFATIPCAPGVAGGQEDECCKHDVIRETLEEFRALGVNALVVYMWAEGKVVSKMLKEMNYNVDVFYSINEVATDENFDMEYVITSKLWAEDSNGKDPFWGGNREMVQLYKSLSGGETMIDWTARDMTMGPILSEAIKVSTMDDIFNFDKLNTIIEENVIPESFFGEIRYRGFRYNQGFETIEVQVQNGKHVTTLPDRMAAEPFIIPLPTFECRGGVCSKCPSGTTGDYSFMRCKNCDAGFYSEGGPNSTCSPCAPGYHSQQPGSASCHMCEEGTFQRYAGKAECDQCPVGYTCAEGALEPAPCAIGTYKDSVGKGECKTCPVGFTTLSQSASSSSDCVCEVGTYVAQRGGEVACLPCPEGLQCSGANHEPTQKEGYRTAGREADDGFTVYQCTSSIACPAGVLATCGTDRIGDVCGQCAEGMYEETSLGCAECGDSYDGIAGTIYFFVIVLLLVIFFFRAKGLERNAMNPAEDAPCLFIWTFQYIQALALIGKMAMRSPDSTDDTMKGLDWSLDPAARMGSLECSSFGRTFPGNYIFLLCGPFYALAVIGVAFGITLVLSKWKEDFKLSVHATFGCCGAIFTFFFVGITNQVVKLFDCYAHPHDQSSLRWAPNVFCYEGAWNGALGPAIVAILIFLVAPIVVFAYILRIAPARSEERDFRMRWRFLFCKFNITSYYFALAYFARGMALPLAVALFQTAEGQMLWFAAVLLAYCVGLLYVRPYASDRIFHSDLCTHVVLLFLLFCVPFFSEQDNYKTPEGKAIGTLVIIVGVIPFIVNAGLFCLVAVEKVKGNSLDAKSGESSAKTSNVEDLMKQNVALNEENAALSATLKTLQEQVGADVGKSLVVAQV